MKDINRIVIAGMGALGMLYGDQIRKGAEGASLCFLMDEARKKRHESDVYRINGEVCEYDVRTPEEYEGAADLVIVATKYGALRDAAELIRPVVDQDTTIISVLNGISSEEILAEYYNYDQIIDCVAIGMDAMRDGSELTYQNAGRLQIGTRSEDQQARLDQLAAFMEHANMPHEVRADIKHAMWNKFMINVGINQTCMVYNTTYSGAVAPGPANDDMVNAMKEVIAIAKFEGIDLTEADMEADLKILRSLNPDGYPSMQQDALAGRRSEVDLFAGTVVKIAKKHCVSVPVNKKFLEIIKERESR